MQNSELLKAVNTSLIDCNIDSAKELQHKLLVNRPRRKILSAIINELQECDEFIISVAFITKSGVSQLKNTLKILERKGVKGKIITGDYLNFTDPLALYELNGFKNIEIKLITKRNFHAKGYFFKKGNNWNIILGSSNLTQAALTKTEEWNVQLSSTAEGEFVNQLLTEFDILWKSTVNNSNALEDYHNFYVRNKQEMALKNHLYKEYLTGQQKDERINYEPNTMQKRALSALKNLRLKKEKRALIISATGTGKTILSAFDVIEESPKKLLFIVHRENIARKSMNTYQQMIKDKSCGLLTGSQKDVNADYIFTTIQTLNNYKELFEPEYFDYIIIDEVHHGGAQTYQKVYNYFKPKFSLGMTATPMRTDGFDIFAMYDNNIAFEYKLSEALDEELLTPFHYFGVSDIEIDGKSIDENSNIYQLTSNARTEHIVNKMKFYGHSGDRVHGLIFVSNVNEAKILSKNLNECGYRTKALTGSDNEDVRIATISKLENGDLDYIITVDIFNEGIDIPCINQVVLLRPTTSAIVYIQQIGRGLRKTIEKDYVVLIDFIGNYKNNYLIPIAIGNTGTYDKDKIKKEIILNGVGYLTGESVLQFEEVVQAKLLKQISEVNFSTLANIKRDYEYLKLKYDRLPRLVDFVNNELISPEVILSGTYKNYPIIKGKFEKIKQNFSEKETLFLDYVSQVIFPAKRLHEIYIIELIIQTKKIEKQLLVSKVGAYYDTDQLSVIENTLLHLSRKIFMSLSDEKKYIPFINLNSDVVSISAEFNAAIENEEFQAELVDILETCKIIYDKEMYEKNSLFTVGKLYDRKQAYRYSLHDYNNGYQVSGYTPFKDDKNKEVLVFITLDNSSSFTSYENTLLNNKTITWFSKASRRLYREDGEITIEGEIANEQIPLKMFVKRSKSENFYYLGEVHKVIDFTQILNAKGKSIIKYTLELDNELDNDLFKYLTLSE